MKVEIQKELADRKPLAEIAEAANPVLEKTLGRAGSRITATWGFRSDERGLPKIQLTISDPLAGDSSKEFTPEELDGMDDMRWTFSRFWGDHLSEGTRRKLELLESLSTE